MLLKIKHLASRVAAKSYPFVSSNRFFYATVLLLVLEAGWLALMTVYPQAFDEQFHLGISKIYAQQYSPFFTSQPPNADVFGAVVRDPSYMYHYLMSFPYRWLTFITDSEALQGIILRFTSISIIAWAMFVYRRVLLTAGIPKGVVHSDFCFFVVTPAVPLLAAHINYDNLMILLTGYTLLLAIRMLRSVHTKGVLPLAPAYNF